MDIYPESRYIHTFPQFLRADLFGQRHSQLLPGHRSGTRWLQHGVRTSSRSHWFRHGAFHSLDIITPRTTHILSSHTQLARGNAFIDRMSIGGPSPLVPPLPGKIDGPVAGGIATHGRFEGGAILR